MSSSEKDGIDNDRTPLQNLVGSKSFDAVILLVIFINCVLLAVYSPANHVSLGLYVVGIIFDAIFISEVVVRMMAFGIRQYFGDSLHYIDLIVSLASLVEVVIIVIGKIYRDIHRSSPISSTGGLKIISLLRILRVLRPLKALTFLPFVLAYISALFTSARSILLNVIFLGLAVAALSCASYALIQDALTYRCVPGSDITSDQLNSNQYYLQFGLDYFYSKYNIDYCGFKNCANGYVCAQVAEQFSGVPADFKNPWVSLIAIMSFVTLRGWPHIFWAIADTKGPFIAIFLLVLIPSVTTFMIANLFPAIFIISLKEGEESQKKRELLSLYPGNIQEISELELLLWANKNHNEILLKQLQGDSNHKDPEIEQNLKVIKDSESQKKNESVIESKEEDGENQNEGPQIKIEEEETKICVPNCLGCSKLRSIFASDQSMFNKVMIAVVIMNIFMLSIDSPYANYATNEAIRITNIIFLALYCFDCAIKFFVLGPVRYFYNIFNLIDLALTIMGILSVASLLPRFVTNFRVFRLIRLLRLYRILSLVNIKEENKLKSSVITLEKLAFILEDSSLPLLNVSLSLLLILYMYSVLGMQLFYNYDFSGTIELDPSIHLTEYALTLAQSGKDLIQLTDLNSFWAGASLSRMHFGYFSASFLTMFNVMTLNSWHEIMMNTVIATKSNSTPWFFFIWIIISNYFVISTLIAAITTTMERYAQSNLNDNAKLNKRIVERLRDIRYKLLLKKSFKLVMKNTIEGADALTYSEDDVTMSRRRKIKVVDAFEVPPVEPFWKSFFTRRSTYSLYLFSRQGHIRQFCTWLSDSAFVNWLVAIAICISVISIISNNSTFVMSEKNWNITNFYVPLVFLFEMALQWISLSWWDGPDAYFKSPIYIIDCIVNITLIINYSVAVDLSDVRIARLAKVPQLILIASKSRTMRLIMQSYKDSFLSLVSLISMLFTVIAFFGVLGLQLWEGTFSHCAYSGYDQGKYRYGSYSDFPYGCNGTALVPVYSTYEYVSLHWITPDDSFDNIFKACKSTFKIFLMNNWATIMYDSLDYTSFNYEPKINNQPASFLFFIILTFISIAVGVLFTAIVYYHFYLSAMTNGRKIIFGDNDALWMTFEEKLCNVQVSDQFFKNSEFLHYLFNNSWLYQFIVLCFTMIPVVLLVAFRKISYGNQFMVTVDCALSGIYVFEYLIRLYSKKYRFYQSISAKQELVVVFFLLGIIFVCIGNTSGSLPGNTSIIVISCSVFLRTFRLSISYPEIATFLRTLYLSMSGFAPTLLNLVFLIIVYGEVGYFSFKNVKMNYGNDFLNSHYNFNDILSACITLGAMITGNMYTEVINQLKSGNSLGWIIYIELYFTTFYLLTFFILKAFAIIVISKFTIYSGGSIGLAKQQLRHFRKAWQKYKNPSRINFPTMLDFLRDLHAPLGFKGHADRTYLHSIRFAKKLLLCMPADVPYFDDSDPGASRQIFTLKDLSSDDDVRKLEGEGHSFSFRQMIIAVHKRAMLGTELADEEEFEMKRLIHKERLSLLRLRLGRLFNSKADQMFKLKGDTHSIAFLNQLMIQRLDPKLYRQLYVKIITNSLIGLKKRIQSYGFNGFDGFMINKLVRVTKNEFNAASLQYQLKKLLNPKGIGHVSKQIAEAEAKSFALAAKKLFEQSKEMSEANVEKLWKVSSIRQVIRLKERGTVSAIVVDAHNTIYAGFSKGGVKIWMNSGGYGEVNESNRFKIQQSIHLKEPVYAIILSQDGHRMVVACGMQVIIYGLRGGQGKRRNIFVENNRFKDHSDIVYGAISLQKYIVSAGKDGYILLNSLTTNQVLNSYYCGSSIYCLLQMCVDSDSFGSDDINLTDVAVCGLANGYVNFFPLPLSFGSSGNESTTWECLSLYAGDCSISSLKYYWNFLYVGFVDGTIKAWSVSLDKKLNSSKHPIRMLQLSKVQSFNIHAGPVTSICFTGGHMFTASHDFSILPWNPPEKLKAKTEAEFSQSPLSGIIHHSHPIVCMANNKYVLVSGDDHGNIIVSAPAVIGDKLASTGDAITNKCQFSFLEYDFKMCFVPHNGVTIEEECYLNITNVSEESLTIRCLMKKNDTFTVETNIIQNMKLGARLVKITTSSGKKVDAVEFGSSRSVQFRFVFTPQVETLYQQLVEFLINESHIIRVMLRGNGIKPKVMVEGGRGNIDFESVLVGKKENKSLTIHNLSPRAICCNLLDDEVEQLGGGEISLSRKYIQIIPPCFTIPPNSNKTISIIFEPEIEMPTYEIPLRFVCAGSVNTLAKIRARSQHPNQSNQHKLALKSPDDGISSLQVTKYSIAKQGMRKLLNSESFCPGDITNTMLNSNGYRISYDNFTCCLLHYNSGAFLEIVNPSKRMPHVKQHVNKIQIHILCSHNINNDSERRKFNAKKFYEIWHGDRLLSYGKVDVNHRSTVEIDCSEVYFGNETNKIEAIGYQTLELLVFSWGEKRRQSKKFLTPKATTPETNQKYRSIFGSLESITYIKIVKGFRICKASDDVLYQTYDRVDVVGIERVTTFLNDEKIMLSHHEISKLKSYADLNKVNENKDLANGEMIVNPGGNFIGIVSQTFGEYDDAGGDPSDLGTPILSPVKITLHCPDNSTHYKVEDKVYVKVNSHLIKEHTAIHTDAFKNTNGKEMIDLKRPVAKDLVITEENVTRTVDISIYRKETKTDSGVTESKLVSKASVDTHSVKGVASRSQACGLNPYMLLPHEIISVPLSVGVDIVTPPDESLERVSVVNLMLDRMYWGKESISDSLDKLFQVMWYFILDGTRLKLVSADPSIGVYADVYDVSAVEILFDSHGLQIRLEDNSGISCDSGLVIREDDFNDLPDPSYDTIRLTNVHGKSYSLNQPPKFLLKVWETVCKDSMLKELKAGLMKLVQKRQLELRRQAEIESAKLLSDLANKEQAILANRKLKQLLPKELMERRDVELKATKLIDDLPHQNTYKEVFEEMDRLTTERYADTDGDKPFATKNFSRANAIKKISISKLTKFLEEVSLPGADEPLTHSQAEVILRDIVVDFNGNITMAFFKEWFNAEDGKKELETLTDKNIFSFMLEDEIKTIEGQSDVVTPEFDLKEMSADDHHATAIHEIHKADKLNRGLLSRTYTFLANPDGKVRKLFRINTANSLMSKLSGRDDCYSEDIDNMNTETKVDIAHTSEEHVPKKRNWFNFKRKNVDANPEVGVNTTQVNRGEYEMINTGQPIGFTDIRLEASESMNTDDNWHYLEAKRDDALEQVDDDDDDDGSLFEVDEDEDDNDDDSED